MLDLADQGVAGIGTCALVVECLDGKFVDHCKEILFLDAPLLDGGGDVQLLLQLLDACYQGLYPHRLRVA
ncbi:hypothetical protein SDC9_54976 [bioreactor metagenome]|uniref:Uncharacterized protein n=1 Tax=bioreactor metagenome TaxID=1076179 RepID=A0A644WXW1_9ZZZZ